MTTERVWQGVHDDAPTNDDGVPIHPEKGYPICGYPKTDAVDKNGRKRTDIPYCTLQAGWGTDRSTGICSKHGGAGGAPTGWRNGAARHLLYSEEMSEDDAEVFEQIAVGSGDEEELMSLDDAVDLLKNMVAWESTRLKRAISETPDVELVQIYKCPDCGNTEKRDAPPHGCDNRYMTQDGVRECTYGGAYELDKSWVEFHDKAVERKESHVANLVQTIKRVSEGTDVNVSGSHDVTHKGDPEAPVEVSITHAGIDLPTDERVDDDAEEDDDSND